MNFPFSQLFSESFAKINAKNTGFVDLNEEIKHLNTIIWKSKQSGFDLAQVQPYSVYEVLETIVTLGISIAPSKKLAFVSGALDVCGNPIMTITIGYRGEIALATQFNIIRSASASLVFENDKFRFLGTNQEVQHMITSLSSEQRGKCSGGYCRAVLADGEILNATLSIEEMDAIGSTQIENMQGQTPWNGIWRDEMRKVALYRRASKDWRQRLYSNPALINSLIYTDVA